MHYQDTWARPLTVTVPFYLLQCTRANSILGIALEFTVYRHVVSSPVENTRRNTPCCFVLRKLGKAPAVCGEQYKILLVSSYYTNWENVTCFGR